MSATAREFDHLPCIRCGYDLRGLPESGSCPECGTPIVDTVMRRSFAGCDPAWLRRVARGSVLLHNGLLLVTAWVAIMVAISVVMLIFAGTPVLPGPVLAVALIALGVPMLAGAGMTAAGAWMISGAEPASHETAGERFAGWAVRGAAPLAIAGAPVALALEVVQPAWVLVLAAGLHALSWRLIVIAQRSGRRAAVVAPRMLRVWTAVLLGLVALTVPGLFASVLENVLPAWAQQLLLGAAVLTGGAAVLVGLASLALLLRSASGVRDELEWVLRDG